MAKLNKRMRLEERQAKVRETRRSKRRNRQVFRQEVGNSVAEMMELRGGQTRNNNRTMRRPPVHHTV